MRNHDPSNGENMNCPHCDNEVSAGARSCPNCNGTMAGDPAIGPSGPSDAACIPTKFAWFLALLPLLAELTLVVLAVLVPPSTEEGAQMLGIIVLSVYFAANLFVLHKDEKLLAEARRRDEMLVFMRIGIFFAPVYLCARAAKTDRKWAYAIVGSLFGIYWWWGWIFN